MRAATAARPPRERARARAATRHSPARRCRRSKVRPAPRRRGSRRLDPLPQQAVQNLRRPTGTVFRRAEYVGDPTGRHLHGLRRAVACRVLQTTEHGCGFTTVDRPPVGSRGRVLALPRRLRRRRVNVGGAGVRMTPQPVQSAEPLGQGAHTARLGDQVFGVDIGAYLQGLRGHDDQMPLAGRSGISAGRHAVDGIENPAAHPLRFALAGPAGQEQDLGRSARHSLAEAVERRPRRDRRCWRTRCTTRVGAHRRADRARRRPVFFAVSAGFPEPSSVSSCSAMSLAASRRCRTTACASSSSSSSNRSLPLASPVAVRDTSTGRDRAAPRMACAPGVHSVRAGNSFRKCGARCASSSKTRLSVPAMAASTTRIRDRDP